MDPVIRPVNAATYVIQQRAPFKNFKNLNPELIFFVNYILKFLCIRSDPNSLAKKSNIFKVQPLKDDSTKEAQFLQSVYSACYYIPRPKDIKKIQDQILTTHVLTFCKKAQQKMIEIGKFKESICNLISTHKKITALSSDQHKIYLDELKITYLEMKNDLYTTYTTLLKTLDNRIQACQTLVNNEHKSFSLLGAVTDNAPDYLMKNHAEFYNKKNSFVRLKENIDEQKNKIDITCSEFENPFNQLYHFLINPGHSVTMNTASFLVGSVFGCFNELSTGKPTNKVRQETNTMSEIQIDIKDLSDEDDLHIIRLFELILNKSSSAKINIQDLPQHNFVKIEATEIDKISKPDDEPRELAIEKINLVNRNFLLNQTTVFVNSWTPCLNIQRNKEDAALIAQIKDLISCVTTLNEIICDSIPLIDKYKRENRELKDLRKIFIAHTDREIIKIHSAQKAVQEKIGKRFVCNPSRISEKAVLISKSHDKVGRCEISTYVTTYHTNTSTIEAEMKKFMEILPKINESKAQFKQKYSYVRYFMESENSSETDFNFWYLMNYYNYFDTDIDTKADEEENE